MASWDDDDEMETHSVTTFFFEDEDKSPVSFGEMPLLFSDAGKPENGEAEVFLRGTTDAGLHVYKQVIAWKLVLEKDQPKVMVLSKDNKWITLLKPRMSYLEGTIRTIMITVQMLHFLRRKPEASEKSLWEHLRKVFSALDPKPSFGDLRDHIPLLKLFTEKNETLSKSQVLLGFLKGKPSQKSSEDVLYAPNFKQSSSSTADEVDEDEDGLEDENAFYDSVCAICDNGGVLLCCDGRCLRSFHATEATAGEDSNCESLGLNDAEVEAMPTFLCKNCLSKKHQCFACGELGSSDKDTGAEVYPCVSATCGHFYHPNCIAKLLYPHDEAQKSELEKNIVDGTTFTCPAHKCTVCHQGEKKNDPSLQFAMCRRCPTSYHKKCLPREILFEDPDDETVIARAWTGLLPHRILIYCLKHEIDEELGTPIRDHLKFPDDPKGANLLKVKKNNDKVLMKKKDKVSVELAIGKTIHKKIQVSERVSIPKGNQFEEKIKRNATQKAFSTQKIFKSTAEPDSSRIGVRRTFENNILSSEDKKKMVESGTIAKPTGKVLKASFPPIDSGTERKARDLINKASSSFHPDDVAKMLTIPSTHASYRKQMIYKNITHGKVEGTVEAIKSALQKLEHGNSVEDIQAVCEPEILKQLLRWHNKFKVYLAPFLHGMRYTSFGRHFTKVDKLKEIVDKLQWYVHSGDTIVDFCCGANDFSQLMKGKLDAAGKKCYFKNYDVIQPKNDFNFERRDWMTVTTDELPNGSKLIMGLNPPFGVKAMLANKFIDKALTFKPKLIILIVPRETKRLDQKAPQYDLIWEDGLSLSGKSFYLPGSVDINDRQMDQWNLKPPVLYLWSRPDWTSNHKGIALNHGHISTELKEINLEGERQLEAERQVIPTMGKTEQRFEKHKDSTARKMEVEEKIKVLSEISEKRKSPQNQYNASDRKKKKAGVREDRDVDGSSEMSISSDDHLEPRIRSTSCTPLEPNEIPTRDKHDLSLGGRTEFRETLQSTSVHGNNFPETVRRYRTSDRGGTLERISHDYPISGTSSEKFGLQGSEGQFFNYARDTDTLNWNPYLSDIHDYGRPQEADWQMQVRLYGGSQEEPHQRNRFSLHGGSRAGNAHLPFMEPNAPSAMMRYAPRLDEINYARPGSQLPVGPGGGMSRDIPQDPMGFAPGPHPSSFRPGASGGWLGD